MFSVVYNHLKKKYYAYSVLELAFYIYKHHMSSYMKSIMSLQ